jgi:ribose 5-phosphate isomerase B
MKISIASDHGGFDLKEDLRAWLTGQGHEVVDFGCHGKESCDYPDFAGPAARAAASGECERGIVICTTGIGVSMTANKVKGVRCALCGDPWSAEMTRRHNDANVLAIGAGVTGPLLARQIVTAFLTHEFEGGRHQRRVDKVMSTEA